MSLQHRHAIISFSMDKHLLGSSIAMITFQQAEIGYGSAPLFPPLNSHVPSGSLTAVVGVNGAGKSTLLKTIAGLLPLLGGSLRFNSHQLPHMAYLPQKIELDLQFPIQVSDLVSMGYWVQNSMFSACSVCTSQHIMEALDYVGMAAMARFPIGELSYGQLQRVLFARLLVQQASLILLDEPFSGIDSATTKFLLQVIEQLHQQKRTLIIVLHDMSLVTNHFSQVLLLTPQCCHYGDTHQILEHIPTPNIANRSQYKIIVTS